MTCEALFSISCCLLQLITVGVVAWAARDYIRARGWLVNIMSLGQRVTPRMDELIDELLENEPAPVSQTTAVGAADVPTAATDTTYRQERRERLAALAAGGQARQYLGKAWTVEQIDSLGEDEVEKLYARYEARLGAAMSKTLGRAALQLYSSLASMFLPIPPENRLPLMADLEADPFVGHALNGASCEIYHRYGMFLAPLTAALTTAKYCQFGRQGSVVHNGQHDDGGEPRLTHTCDGDTFGVPASVADKSDRPGDRGEDFAS